MNPRILLFALIFAATPQRWAFADEEAKDAVTDQARKLHDEGTTLFEKQDYAGAYAAFAAAYSLKRHYQIAGSLGDCEMQLGRNRDAAEHLDSFIREYPPGDPPEQLERAKALLARARLGAATLVFDVPMTGTQVFLDGQPIGKAPIEGERFVEPGQHRIEAMAGLELVRQMVDVSAGEQRVVKLEAAPAPKTEKPIAAKWGTPKIAAVVAGGLAVASGGVGIGLLSFAESQRVEKNDLLNKLAAQSGAPVSGVCGNGTGYGQECNQINDLADNTRLLGHGAIVAFAVGAAAGAVSLGFALSSANSSTKPKIEVSAFVTPTGSGFVMGGRF